MRKGRHRRFYEAFFGVLLDLLDQNLPLLAHFYCLASQTGSVLILHNDLELFLLVNDA